MALGSQTGSEGPIPNSSMNPLKNTMYGKKSIEGNSGLFANYPTFNKAAFVKN